MVSDGLTLYKDFLNAGAPQKTFDGPVCACDVEGQECTCGEGECKCECECCAPAEEGTNVEQ